MMTTEQAAKELDTLRWKARTSANFDMTAFGEEQIRIWSEFKDHLATLSPNLNEAQREVVYEMASDLMDDMDPGTGNEITIIGRTYAKMVQMMNDVSNAESVQFDR